MPLKKIIFKAGVNRENTRYTNEGGWYASEKVRFRQGTPEKIGGWQRISGYTYQGVCRSLWNWVTLGGLNLIGVGTNLKFYIERGGRYNDITPLRGFAQSPVTLSNPFDTVNGSPDINVNDTAHGLSTGDIVTFSGSTAVGGIPADFINTSHTVTVVGADDYTITVPTDATSTVTGGGGVAVVATYTWLTYNLTDPFSTVSGSPTVTVHQTAHGAVTGDFVTFTSSAAVGGLTISGEYQVTYVDANSYSINAGANASSTVTYPPGGGGTVTAQYQLNVGPEFQIPLVGWGAGPWGGGPWGIGAPSIASLRIWSQSNFGEDLVFGPRGGGIYLWDATNGVGTRGVNIAYLWGASNVPTVQNFTFISDINRFVFAFGCDDIGSPVQDPMLIRWSDQESVVDWTPSATTQAGSVRLSHGSEIITAVQTRQEIVVFTDSSLYSLQYLGAPIVWGTQLLGDNISIMGQNAVAVASGVVYWMGVDKFYKYDGRVLTLRCDLRQFIYSDINMSQSQQVFAGTNEGFNEVWWFYCSADSTVVDKYVVYNYAEDIWYYGTMGRTAWLDSGLRDYPLAATYTYNLVNHEQGVDDNETETPLPIAASIGSSEFDIDDGDHFGFIWRVLPDITFRGSTDGTEPQVTMTMIPMQNSGSGSNIPASVGGNDSATVQRITNATIETFTGQIYVRVRGRQMIFEVSSNRIGTQWQLGAPRFDIKQDGRRGNT